MKFIVTTITIIGENLLLNNGQESSVWWIWAVLVIVELSVSSRRRAMITLIKPTCCKTSSSSYSPPSSSSSLSPPSSPLSSSTSQWAMITLIKPQVEAPRWNVFLWTTFSTGKMKSFSCSALDCGLLLFVQFCTSVCFGIWKALLCNVRRLSSAGGSECCIFCVICIFCVLFIFFY